MGRWSRIAVGPAASTDRPHPTADPSQPTRGCPDQESPPVTIARVEVIPVRTPPASAAANDARAWWVTTPFSPFTVAYDLCRATLNFGYPRRSTQKRIPRAPADTVP